MTKSFKNILNEIQLKPFKDLSLNLFTNHVSSQNNKLATASSQETLLLKLGEGSA